MFHLQVRRSVEEETLAIEQTRLRWVLGYDYLFVSRTQLEYDVMFSRTFYEKLDKQVFLSSGYISSFNIPVCALLSWIDL